AQLKSASTGSPMRRTAASIDSSLMRFVSIHEPFLASRRSSATTTAPRPATMRAVASPMPDAAPVTTTRLPAYESLLSMADLDADLSDVLAEEQVLERRARLGEREDPVDHRLHRVERDGAIHVEELGAAADEHAL